MIIYESSLRGLAAVALDGEAGKVHSLLFDDRDWRVGHITVRTGSWLSGRIAAIPPAAVTIPTRHLDRLAVLLKREELKHCPDIESAKPVSLQEETRLQNQRAIIGSPYEGFAGALMVPTATAERELGEVSEAAVAGCDPHLRSTKGVRRYQVRLREGEPLGRVLDFVVDTGRWQITHLVIRVQGWPRQRRLVIPSSAVEGISWFEQAITTRLSPLSSEQRNRTATARSRPRTRLREKRRLHTGTKARK